MDDPPTTALSSVLLIVKLLLPKINKPKFKFKLPVIVVEFVSVTPAGNATPFSIVKLANVFAVGVVVKIPVIWAALLLL